jgi:phosphatidylserine decarboxylase
MQFASIATLLVVSLALYLYWRYVWFYRDPERQTPIDAGAIFSPADGTVIYIKRVTGDEPPISLKNGREVPLDKFLGKAEIRRSGFLIGVFMHPSSVHVNRSPVTGTVRAVEHKPGSNLPMALTLWRTNLGLRPFEAHAAYLLQNERNIIWLSASVDVLVVQIADISVNRIECRVSAGEQVSAGQRIGMIRFGSQVDLFIADESVEIVANVGQRVIAGETVLARNTRS